uniref:Uncharacterized protein n=1 Tax=Amphimedon queenslandica TaxID=400682 RepID=A0A1X7UD87_AMPQE
MECESSTASSVSPTNSMFHGLQNNKHDIKSQNYIRMDVISYQFCILGQNASCKCRRDKQRPKLYSKVNNIIPLEIPNELIANAFNSIIIITTMYFGIITN